MPRRNALISFYSGLARFDGVRFTTFDENNTPEMRSSRVTSLFEAADGTLWIGDESGQVTRYRDGQFEAVPLMQVVCMQLIVPPTVEIEIECGHDF
jgi:ligand-binding sensor domain-containing protein